MVRRIGPHSPRCPIWAATTSAQAAPEFPALPRPVRLISAGPMDYVDCVQNKNVPAVVLDRVEDLPIGDADPNPIVD